MRQLNTLMFSQSTLRKAAALGCLSLAGMPLVSAQAAAPNVCTNAGGLNTINTAQTSGDQCVLGGVSASVDVTSTGSLSGADSAIFVVSGSTITNSGTVSGTLYGINVPGPNSLYTGVTNSGTISGGNSGSGAGISVRSGASLGGGIHNLSGGTISGGAGIELTTGANFGGDILNEAGGTITGSTAGIYIIGANAFSSGGITNKGTVYGANTGIVISSTTISSGISNTGTITGGNTGTFIGNGSIIGSMTNSGTITGSLYAMYTDATAVIQADIQNIDGGTIDGRIHLLNGTNFSNGGSLLLPDNTVSTIDGNYTQTGTGALSFGVTSLTSYATLVVNGTADLTASGALVMNVGAGDTLAIGNVLAGVLTAGTLTANALTVTDNSALWNFTAAVNGNAIDITTIAGLTVTDAVADTGSSAASGVATVLDGFVSGSTTPTGDMSTVINALNTLTTDTDVSNAAQQLVPLLNSGVATTTMNANNSGGTRVVHNRLGQLSGLASGDVAPDRYVWAQPFGSWTTQDTRNGVSGNKADTAGLAIGTDANINNDWRLGGAVSYARTGVDTKSSAQDDSLDIETFQGTVYASGTVLGDKTLNLQASVGFNGNDSQRNITFGGLNRIAKADFNSQSTQLGAEMAYTPVALNAKTTLTPVAGVNYSYVYVDGYTETGAGAANLKVEDSSEDALVLSIGGRLAHQMNDDTTLTAHLDVGHDVLADQSSVTSTFTGGGASFQTAGIEPASTVVKGGVGMTMQTQSNLEITAGYDIEARSGFDNQSLSVKLRWPF